MDLIYLEESVGPMLLLTTWLSGFTKLESLRMFNWRGRGGWLGFARLP